MAVAFAYLVRAAWLHRSLGTTDLLARLQAASAATDPLPTGRRREIGRALAGLSRRMPWRSDCLVQALAARLWLDALGAHSELRLGAWREDDAVAAHAWLLSDGEVVTGGRLDPKIAPFAPPVPRQDPSPDAAGPDPAPERPPGQALPR
ncbi:MAG: lasso peptide biosynthesis B2 protein [Paracoccaceae bacterium]